MLEVMQKLARRRANDRKATTDPRTDPAAKNAEAAAPPPHDNRVRLRANP
jgi:hypothetical protein